MKKLLIASLIALTTTLSYADVNIHAKAEQMFKEKKFDESFKEYQRLAKAGDAKSMFNLGQLTRAGFDTKINHKQALAYIKKAAQQNYANAELALFDIYTTGELGVKPDPIQARKHLERASQLGLSDATVELANQYFAEGNDQSNQKGIALLEPLVKENNQAAQHLLAVYYIISGVKTANEETLMQGIKTLETLTKQGYIPSMLAVANMAATGEVLPQDLSLAKYLYTILADNQVPMAKERLAQVEQLLAESAPTKTPTQESQQQKKKKK